MNRKTLALAVVAATFAFAVPVTQAQEVASTPEARVAQAAKQGPDALRRFVHRTRMIYGFHFHDFYPVAE